MRLKREKGERKVSALSHLLTDVKRKKILSLLFIVIITLALGIIVLSLLNYWIPAAILSFFIIPLTIIIVRKHYSAIDSQENVISVMQKVIEQKEEYISVFSHRIRTPLNNFSFISEYLMKTNPEVNQKEMLETLIASTTNMVEVVNDLTMKTAQVISYSPRKDIKYNLYSALASTIELFEVNTDNSILFKIEQAEGLSDYYLGDPITIKQIFLDIFNIISSGKEKPSTINVTIEGDRSNIKKEKVKFSIISDKPISAFGSDSNITDHNDLMAIKLIVGINGTYGYDEGSENSVFSFTLPLVVAYEEKSESKAAERIKELNTESKSQKKLTDANILLVEDNPTNQKIVLITLSSLVKNIDTAETGKEALDLFGKSNYDIILMDIQLPVMDGITVAKKIREIEKSTSQHTPIIAITANAMIGDKEKCLSAGMDEYLSKPFQPSQLIAIIEKFVTS